MSIKSRITAALTSILRAAFGPAGDLERISLHVARLADEAEAASDATSRRLESLRQEIDHLEAEEERLLDKRVELRQLANRLYDITMRSIDQD